MELAITRNKKAVDLLKSMFDEWNNLFNAKDVLIYEGHAVSEKWMKDFLYIPKKYRVNPFDYVDSGDVYFADKRNIDNIDKSLENVRKGKVKKLSREKQKVFLGIN